MPKISPYGRNDREGPRKWHRNYRHCSMKKLVISTNEVRGNLMAVQVSSLKAQGQDSSLADVPSLPTKDSHITVWYNYFFLLSDSFFLVATFTPFDGSILGSFTWSAFRRFSFIWFGFGIIWNRGLFFIWIVWVIIKVRHFIAAFTVISICAHASSRHLLIISANITVVCFIAVLLLRTLEVMLRDRWEKTSSESALPLHLRSVTLTKWNKAYLVCLLYGSREKGGRARKAKNADLQTQWHIHHSTFNIKNSTFFSPSHYPQTTVHYFSTYEVGEET